MPNYSRRGHRVKIRYELRTAYRTFLGTECGTIIYEISNGFGRVLVQVEWDEGGDSPVFPEEIEPIR